MYVLKTDPKAKAPETAPFVEIDGVVYEAPLKLPANEALEFIEIQTERGSDASTIWLMEKCLGPAGYQAVKSFKQLDAAELTGMIVELRTRALGSLEESGKADSSD